MSPVSVVEREYEVDRPLAERSADEVDVFSLHDSDIVLVRFTVRV